MWLDLDRTCEEIARFSRSDADAYRRLIAEYDEVKGIFGRARVTPPGFGPSLEEMLLEHPRGRIWLRRNAITAWDVIRREFEDRHVQAFMIWQAFQTLVPDGRRGLRGQRLLDHLRPPGTQLVGPARRVRRADRGAHALPRGPRLDRPLQPAGVAARARGRALHRRRDRRRRALHGEARGALDDPRQAARRDGAARGVGRGVRLRRRHLRRRDVRHGVLPRHRRGAGVPDAGRPARGRLGRDGRAGRRRCSRSGARCATGARTTTGVPWLLVATPTLVDPDRAPEGHHTIKLLSPQTWDLPEGVASWEEHKETIFRRQLEHVRRFIPALSDEHILTSLREEPGGHRALEPAHGPRRVPRRRPQLSRSAAKNRPVPGWADHRMPIPGLYQTGGTTSVGGSVTGVPGPQRRDGDAERPRTRPGGGDGRCRTRACRQPLTTGRRASCRRGWTTATSS